MMSRLRLRLLLLITLLAACGHAPKKGMVKEEAVNPYYYLVRSNLKAFEGDLSTSLADLEKALEVYPDNAFLKYLAAERHAKMNALDKAQALIQEVLTIKPDWFDAEMLSAQILEAKGQFKEAGQIYIKLIGQRPKEEQGYFQLAQNLVHQEKYHEAIQILRSWLAQQPDSITTLFTIATIENIYLKNSGQALQAYQKILQLDPDNFRVRSQMAQIYLKQEKKEKALDQFLKIERVFPQDLSIKLQIAFIYQETEQIDKAIAKLQEMAGINPEADRVQYYLGLLYERGRQDSQALAAFAKVPPASSLYKDAILHRVALLREAKEDEPAIKILKTAITKKSTTPQFYQLLSILYEDNHKPDAAIAILKQGIKKLPKDEDLYFNLGALYDRLKRKEESIQAMRKVLELNPENASALNYIGYTYAEADQNLEEAEAMILKALKLKPKDGYITDSLGWVYFQKGDLKKAFQYLQEALKILPEEPVIVEHMGDIYLKMENRRQARRYFEKALELGKKREKPNLEEIERVEQKLQALSH